MNLKNKIAFLLLAAAFGIGSVSLVNAQQTVPTPDKTASPTPSNDEDEIIKIDTDVVNVLFTAQDKNRRLLTDLKQTDVRLIEDGKAQEIVSFSRQVDLPMSLSILIDTSASQERTLPEEKAAAASFLNSFINPAKDEVSIISFTGETTLEQGMTNNLVRLKRAIDRVTFVPPAGYIGGGVTAGGTAPAMGNSTAGSTAIWDAIWVTSDEVLGAAPEKTRRAIILLTDGVNTSGRKKLEEAALAAQKAEAIIYAVGIGDDFQYGVDEGVLKKIAEKTGGRAYFPKDETDLRRAFNQIQEEMRSQYLIAYEPVNQKRDGTFRKINIELANPELQKQKVKITSRDGYFSKTNK